MDARSPQSISEFSFIKAAIQPKSWGTLKQKSYCRYLLANKKFEGDSLKLFPLYIYLLKRFSHTLHSSVASGRGSSHLLIGSHRQQTVGKTSMVCRAENWTRACLTASLPTANWATMHPDWAIPHPEPEFSNFKDPHASVPRNWFLVRNQFRRGVVTRKRGGGNREKREYTLFLWEKVDSIFKYYQYHIMGPGRLYSILGSYSIPGIDSPLPPNNPS